MLDLANGSHAFITQPLAMSPDDFEKWLGSEHTFSMMEHRNHSAEDLADAALPVGACRC